jgi:hypothetical protein
MSDVRTSDASVKAKVAIERLTQCAGTDLDDLCEATEAAIKEGGGFGWLKPPPRQVLENYWKGVLLIPDRRLRRSSRRRRATTRRSVSPAPSPEPLSRLGRAATGWRAAW